MQTFNNADADIKKKCEGIVGSMKAILQSDKEMVERTYAHQKFLETVFPDVHSQMGNLQEEDKLKKEKDNILQKIAEIESLGDEILSMVSDLDKIGHNLKEGGHEEGLLGINNNLIRMECLINKHRGVYTEPMRRVDFMGYLVPIPAACIYMAANSSGVIYAFREKPKQGKFSYDVSNSDKIYCVNGLRYTGGNWQDSLKYYPPGEGEMI